jgi:hypothetical protein
MRMTGARLVVRYVGAMTLLSALWAWPVTGAALGFAAVLIPPLPFLLGLLAVPREALRYDVSAAGHAIGHAAGGRVAYPLPVPLPYFVCRTNAQDGWRCHAGLATLSLAYGEREGADAYARKAAYLVAVLGLKRARL